jgi:hypothetical protein
MFNYSPHYKAASLQNLEQRAAEFIIVGMA